MRNVSAPSSRLFEVALLLILSVPGCAILLGVFRHPGGPFPAHFWLYVACYVLFAFVFWLAGRGRRQQPRSTWRVAILILQGGLALSMVLLICSGNEGALLVVVAAEVATMFPLVPTLGWIAAQSLLMGRFISLHWPQSLLSSLWVAWLGA